MVKLPSLAAIVAMTALSCTEQPKVTDSIAPDDRVSQMATDLQDAASLVLADTTIDDTAENLAIQAEQAAWQRVVEANPGIDAQDRVEELWTNPTTEFTAYMNLWRSHDLGMEPLYRHGLLSRTLYERYMDLPADYAEFAVYIERVIDLINTSNEFTDAERDSFGKIRRDQLRLLASLTRQIQATPESNNFVDFSTSITQTMREINLAIPANNDSYFTRSSASVPALAWAILIKETMPEMPGDVPVELVYLHSTALLQDSFFANGKISNANMDVFNDRIDCRDDDPETTCDIAHGDKLDETKHIITGFPHLTYSTAEKVFTLIFNSRNIWPYNQIKMIGHPSDEDFVSKNMERMVLDIDFATKIFVCMVHDNRSRFADFVNDVPRARQFLNTPENNLVFAAITTVFNNIGGTTGPYSFVLWLLEQNNYETEGFLSALRTRENYDTWNQAHPEEDMQVGIANGYLTDVDMMYRYLLSVSITTSAE